MDSIQTLMNLKKNNSKGDPEKKHAMSLSLKVNRIVTITLTTSLSNKLGFGGKTVFDSGMHKSNEPFDINSGMHHMCVYSNVIEETCVGNTYVKLLRTVETKEDVFKESYQKHLIRLTINVYLHPMKTALR